LNFFVTFSFQSVILELRLWSPAAAAAFIVIKEQIGERVFKMKSYSIILNGTIASDIKFSHEHKGENFYLFQMAVKRKNGTEDLLPVMVKTSLAGFDDLKEGNRICVKGYINTRAREEGVVPRTQTYVNAYELVPANETDGNFVSVFGYVCANRGLRFTPTGKKITELTVAVPRYHGVSDYVRCICWGDDAEVAKDFENRQKVVLRGRLQSRTYHEDRVAYELSVGHLNKIEPKAEDAKPAEASEK
jgi:hypothetical protein